MLTGRVKLDWQGKLTRKQFVRAVEQGINMTLSKAVQAAKPLTPVRTGILQGSMRMEPAKEIKPNIVAGYFGSFDVNYAIYVEKGTVHFTGFHMLQQAADEAFPNLRDDIKEAFSRRVRI